MYLLSQYSHKILPFFTEKKIYPSCQNCIYHHQNTCKLSIRKYDVRNGIIDFIPVQKMRENNNLCGPEGKFFYPISKQFTRRENIERFFEHIQFRFALTLRVILFIILLFLYHIYHSFIIHIILSPLFSYFYK